MNKPNDNARHQQKNPQQIVDCGPEPFAVNLRKATLDNEFFRRVLWTGRNLQVTLMCIPVGGEIGVEVHPGNDQMLSLLSGRAVVKFGDCRDNLPFSETINDGCAFFVPAGTWHNLINIGNTPIKLYSVYAPPHHPKGTIHRIKPD